MKIDYEKELEAMAIGRAKLDEALKLETNYEKRRQLMRSIHALVMRMQETRRLKEKQELLEEDEDQ